MSKGVLTALLTTLLVVTLVGFVYQKLDWRTKAKAIELLVGEPIPFISGITGNFDSHKNELESIVGFLMEYPEVREIRVSGDRDGQLCARLTSHAACEYIEYPKLESSIKSVATTEVIRSNTEVHFDLGVEIRSDRRFFLSYVYGVHAPDTVQNCRSITLPMKKEGSCRLPLSDSWAVNYFWAPKEYSLTFPQLIAPATVA